MVKRPYITAGFTAFVLMIPLAITSTHRLDSPAGRAALEPAAPADLHHRPGGVLHYCWKVKLDATNPIYYAISVAVLLGFRALA